MNYKTQYLQVLNHFKQYGSITSIEAISNYKITRLSAIILNLRDDGYSIESEWQSNNTKNWVKYIFGKEKTNRTKANSPKERRKEDALIALRNLWTAGESPAIDKGLGDVAELIKKI